MTENLLIDQLKELEQEHRDLDEVLIQLQEKQTVDFLQTHLKHFLKVCFMFFFQRKLNM